MNSHILLDRDALILLGVIPFVVLWLGRTLKNELKIFAHRAVVIALSIAVICCGILALAHPMQEITVHSVAWKGNKVIGLLDVSGSESECFPEESSAEISPCPNAYQAFNKLFIEFIKQHPVDNIGLTMIDDEARILVRLSDGNSEAVRKLLFFAPAFNGTNLRVGIQAALDQFSFGSEQPQFLIVMSDGQDDIKSADLAELKKRIWSLGVQVFFIKNAKPGDDQEYDLDTLVKDVHGTVFTVHNPEEMAAAFFKVSSKIQPQPYTQTMVVAADLTTYCLVAAAALFVLLVIATGNIWFRKWRSYNTN